MMSMGFASKLAIVAAALTIGAPLGVAWLPPNNALVLPSRHSAHSQTLVRYKDRGDNDDTDMNDQVVEPSTLRIDTAFMDPFREQLEPWLNSLTTVTRSDPIWVGEELLHISPSDALQQCFDSLLRQQAVEVFPPNDNALSRKHLFDWDWKYAMVKSLTQQDDWTAKSWKLGQSNTHPLRLQAVAIPAHSSLPPHVHPAVELDIPILGTLYEERSSQLLFVDPDLIDRAPEHSLGSPLSDFSPTPTPLELQTIAQDITERVSEVHQITDFSHDWETHPVVAGQCLLNPVGSVHRSYTQDEACLLFVLGPNVHAHFLKEP
ncbi:acetolactate synthase [Seminavis robusta]|uniref:Acetolactate synthase n=1 Tax=Seminavis robusta TaxID=568900 RepID=A0A9N8DNX7_9STRA|nr:acetolactate synthase [Seminavis robusta]|eukprot:Sro184_g080080.1 acetolactate synthase (319) ;mRNA; f:80182-81138